MPSNYKQRSGRQCRGVTLIYAAISMTVLLGFGMLAIDMGVVQLARSENQTLAVAIARHAAGALEEGNPQVVRQRALLVASDAKIMGQTLKFDASKDVEFGIWDAATRQFLVLSPGEEASSTAIRVTSRMTTARGAAIPTYMGGMFGVKSADIVSSSVVSRGFTIAPRVDGTMTPWLAGMPASAGLDGYDGNPVGRLTGPQYFPASIDLSRFKSGSPLRFRQTEGGTSMHGWSFFSMDGKSDWIVRQRADNGINATSAPIGALMGIFLDDRAPNTYANAAELNFSSEQSRNFAELKPGLKQVFFVGDGLDSSGKLQNFVPPPGATRLFMGIMDEKGWWHDNIGSIRTNLFDTNLSLVK